MGSLNDESPEVDTPSFQKQTEKTTIKSFTQGPAGVNRLLAETLQELHEFLQHANEERRRKEFARRLDDIDRRRWGYPPLRTRERRSRYAA
jgi:hypothetical protein